jgi:outer membrane protein OmpA-like peptidoglycan-associated protein
MLSSSVSNQSMQRWTLQAKLTVNEPGDVYEREADRVADQVMRMPDAHAGLPAGVSSSPQGGATFLQRACSCGGTCDDCQKKADVLQRASASSVAGAPAPPIVHNVLQSSGQPLDHATRSFMEPRFGHDFGQVRIHTDTRASDSAKAVNALAYTVGTNVVFGAGQYTPASPSGRKLLAHELTHVLQQDNSHRDAIQRAEGAGSPLGSGTGGGTTCSADISKVPPPPFCTAVAGPGHRHGDLDFEFSQSNVTLNSMQIADIVTFAGGWKKAGGVQEVFIDGWASCEGPQELNWRLSCQRAEAVKQKLIDNGVAPGKITPFAHGASSEFSTASLAPNRRVIVSTTAVPVPVPKCGPDVTDWFIDEVNRAAADPAVLDIKKDMAFAAALAATIGASATDFAEAGATSAVEAQEKALAVMGIPPPTRSGAIVGQLAAGTASQKSAATATAKALAASVVVPSKRTALILLGTTLASAALKWRVLVNHAARFDFKAHILNHISLGPHCPDPDCPPGEVGNLTLCTGSGLPQNCYEADLPGNLFYALIGRFVGFSELTLQLGSQLAELTDLPRAGRPVVTWDSPQDTAAIHLGFSLGATVPITRAGLCGAVPPTHGSLDALSCDDCLTSFPLKFV